MIENPYENFIALSKYARWMEEENRRETWQETVERYFGFMLGHLKTCNYYPDPELVEQVKQAVLDRNVMPSMRAVMTAGPALERDCVAGYNCSFLPIDSLRSFDEAMYILMCFHPDTMVKTKLGPVAISELSEGDEVLSYDETTEKFVWRPISNVVETPSAKLQKVEVELENGQIIKCTSNHKWLTENRGWVEAGKLTIDDDLVSPKEVRMKIKSIRQIEDNQNYYDITVPDTHNFMLENGSIVHNCGTGVGYSVESVYINRLPVVNEHFEKSNTTIVVEDSKAGWARALRELLAMLWAGQIPTWDTSKVRPAGARLKTFGGRASGPEPLISLFEFCVQTMKGAAGRKLRPIEAHDILCKIGEVVVVGGVRRSAMISLSDLNDTDMAKAKSGNWYLADSQRSLANNSVAYYERPSMSDFMEEWKSLYDSKSGERGIYNVAAAQRQAAKYGRRDPEIRYGTNPCSEIILRPYSFCNLSEVVIRETDSVDDVKNKVRLATILGTWQSTLVDFKYLRKVWRQNAEEERLLGVSLTGQFGHKLFSGQSGKEQLSTVLRELREYAVEINIIEAEFLNINPAAAITCVKPSGTVSQLTGVSSGMHPWHSEYYIRTVRGDKKDPLTNFLMETGIPYEDDVMRPKDTAVFSFPIKAPKNAITRDKISAIEHLDIWLVYQREWCEHKPSITISVRDHEWMEVGAWVFEHFDELSGISFLPYSDHVYRQAPYQDIDKVEYDAAVKAFPKTIVWAMLSLYETSDSTTGSQELACSAGNCEVVDISA